MILDSFLVYKRNLTLVQASINKYEIITIGEVQIKYSFWKFIKNKILNLFGCNNIINYIYLDFNISQSIPDTLLGSYDTVEIQNAARKEKTECYAFLREPERNYKDFAIEITKNLKEYREKW